MTGSDGEIKGWVDLVQSPTPYKHTYRLAVKHCSELEFKPD